MFPLGFCCFLPLRHLRERGVLQDMGIKFGFMLLLLRDGFCSHLSLLVGDTNSKSILKVHMVKLFEAGFCPIPIIWFLSNC